MKITELVAYMDGNYFSYKVGDKLQQDGKLMKNYHTIKAIERIQPCMFGIYDEPIQECFSPDQRRDFDATHQIGLVATPRFRVFSEAD